MLGVGLANSVLGPLLDPRPAMLLEEPEHVERRGRRWCSGAVRCVVTIEVAKAARGFR